MYFVLKIDYNIGYVQVFYLNFLKRLNLDFLCFNNKNSKQAQRRPGSILSFRECVGIFSFVLALSNKIAQRKNKLNIVIKY
jgi:hypothetical protein